MFEFLSLEGAQAGLSWQTILNKRESYRKSFHEFNVEIIARYGKREVRRLLGDPSIVRNRLKIESTISNARRILEIRSEFGSFDKYIWGFVGGRPIKHGLKSLKEIPVTTRESDLMSRDLRGRKLKFVGPTICYAFMQAVGLVNDHTTNCFRYNLSGSK